MRKDGSVLKYVPKEVQKEHPEICMEAVKQDGWALRNVGVRIDIWTHFMRGCIIDYVH